MGVIDFRARPNTTEYMALYDNPASRRNWEVRFRFPKPANETLEAFMANVAAEGIDRIVFTGRQTATRGISNDYIAGCVRQYPDRIVGFAGIDVAAGPPAVAELERAVTRLGLKGVSSIRTPPGPTRAIRASTRSIGRRWSWTCRWSSPWARSSASGVARREWMTSPRSSPT